VELGLDPTIANTIHFELEAESGAVNNHLQRKVQVVELDAAGGRQAREQAPRDGVEIRRQGTGVYQIARVRGRRLVRLASDQIVRHDQALTRPEVTRVVERDGRQRRDGLPLLRYPRR
jgi:hypothetical protein